MGFEEWYAREYPSPTLTGDDYIDASNRGMAEYHKAISEAAWNAAQAERQLTVPQEVLAAARSVQNLRIVLGLVMDYSGGSSEIHAMADFILSLPPQSAPNQDTQVR